MVASVAEYFLQRPLRSVLDIGAGEGVWRSELKRIRPEVRYLGVDPSEYVVQKWGKRRNIRLGTFEQIADQRLGGPFDLIVCADVLQYVDGESLRRGVRHISRLLAGVAFLESYTTADEMEGDLADWHPRSKAEYRQVFSEAGLIACGMHCYLKPSVAENAVELELV